VHTLYRRHLMRSDSLLRIARRKCQSWSSRVRRKKNSGKNSKSSSRRAERSMNLSSNDLPFLFGSNCGTICTMSYYSSCCSQCISSLFVHRRNRCTLIIRTSPRINSAHSWHSALSVLAAFSMVSHHSTLRSEHRLMAE
jgi:hypothetical protein